MQWWALIDAEGEVRGQVETHGDAPSQTGDNPEGMEEVRINAPRDLSAERWNPATRRWRKREGGRGEAQERRAQRFIRRLPDGVLDALADAVAARLKDRTDG